MQLWIQGPAGRLEGLLEEPEEPVEPEEPEETVEARPAGASAAAPSTISGAAIVCHPHPLHGGTLRSTIVFRVARALRAAGLATLRFDFRGVGESEGRHHGGEGPEGEEGDAAAALDELEERYPGAPLWAAGYSFGARTVCGLAARDPRVRRVVLVALPVALYPCTCLERLERPTLLVLGGSDRFGTRADLARSHPELPAGIEVEEITGADHLFRGRTPRLEACVRDYALRSAAEER